MLTFAGLQLPGRTANIFCSATADKRVHDHIVAVDWQLVFEVEVDQRSGCSKRLQGSRWESPLKRVVDATINNGGEVVTFERKTEKNGFPFSFRNGVCWAI